MSSKIELKCPVCSKSKMVYRDSAFDPDEAVQVQIVCPECPNDISMHVSFWNKDGECIEWGRN